MEELYYESPECIFRFLQKNPNSSKRDYYLERGIAQLKGVQEEIVKATKSLEPDLSPNDLEVLRRIDADPLLDRDTMEMSHVARAYVQLNTAYNLLLGLWEVD